MPTMRQIAMTELHNATTEYCEACRNVGKDHARFIRASLRLHQARGGDVPRAAIRESLRVTREN